MRRFLFCAAAAVIGGFAVASVLGLGTASFSAALFKIWSGPEFPVFIFQQKIAPLIWGVAVAGFLVGSVAMVWLFYFDKAGREGPGEAVPDDRSKV